MATDTPSEQWLRERVSVLRYAYTAYLVYLTMLCLKNVDLGSVCKEADQVLSQSLE